jgi:hypothetical protein
VAPLPVIECQADSVPGADTFRRFEEHASVYVYRNIVESSISSKMDPRTADFECEIALAQVAVYRRVGYRRIGQPRRNAILDIVEF